MKGKKRYRAIAAVAALATIGASLTGCSSGSGSSGSASTGSASGVNAALQKGGTITYWGWATGSDKQVAAFEKAYPKVKVNLVNAGTSNTEYTKLQNAIKAGSGAPDVAQIEYFALPQFELTKSLTDLSSYGFSSLKSKYASAAWNAVTSGNKIYGLPQDAGPMALFYNKAIFDKYGLTVPKTWSQYVADAKKLHSADPKEYITSDNGDPGFTTSMIWQAGGHPFSSNGTKVTINLQDAGSKKWADMWNPLVTGGLVAKVPGFSQTWFKELANGQIASLPTGAWMPGNLESSAMAASGNWRVTAMPTYGGGAPVTAQNGGSSQTVLAQSQHKDLAAGFVRWLNSSKASTTLFDQLGNFPSTTANLTSSSFLSAKPAYFGGQAINKVLASASSSVAPGWNYLPFQVYADSVYANTMGQSYVKNSDLNAGLLAWQDALVTYAKAQGFTVSTP